MSAGKRQMLSPMKCQNESATTKRPKIVIKKPAAMNTPEKASVDAAAAQENYDFLFAEDDDFDLAALDAAAAAATTTAKPKQLDLTTWQRCVVETMERDRRSYDLLLQVRAEQCQDKENHDAYATCRLQGPWSQTRVTVGATLSLLCVWDAQLGVYKVDKDHGFCVTNPDTLISGTSVVGSLFCRRKAVLQDRFRGIDANNKVMVIGSLVHELLQMVLRMGLKTQKEIADVAQALLESQETAYTLYASRMTRAETSSEVQKFVPNILTFVRQYVEGQEASAATSGPQSELFEGSITQIHDIEENLWVPQLGLKGKVDVSVHVRRRRNALNFESKAHAIPLELKTGRASFSAEHKGQVILYQMMLSAAGVSETRSGLLLYLREGVLREIPSARNEQRDLIVLRNDLGHFLTQPASLPPAIVDPSAPQGLPEGKLVQPFELPEPISHHSACGNCAYATICCSFAQSDAALQLRDGHPLRKVMAEVTAHLQPADYAYFIHWCGLLALEEQEARKSNYLRSLWTDTPETRQRHGRALIGLQLSDAGVGVDVKDSRYLHTLVVPSAVNSVEAEVDLTLCGFTLGEYVIVSSTRRLAIAAGCVSALTKHSISISLERNLQKNYAGQTFIVDKHESQSGNVFNFTNLGLLLDNSEHSAALRAIIVQREAPTFGKMLPKKVITDGAEIFNELNAVQRSAVLRALRTESFMLIKGLPGTGKTQTLVALVRLLHLMSKTVLITSHTHSAVDNLLLRLRPHKLPLLRLGSGARIHPDLQSCSEGTLLRKCSTEAELAFIYAAYPIVGVTCLGAAHSLFLHRRFDVCIVDEATQVMQSTVLRPLLFCDRFVLVGDPDQLPPLIRSQEARNRGAAESLFQRLDCTAATAVLTLQYRMNKTITKLANELTYGGALQCASDAVKMAAMKLKLSASSTEKWLQRALQTHVDQSVFLLDTSDCAARSLEFASAKHSSDTCATIEQSFAEAELSAEDEDTAATSTANTLEPNSKATAAKRISKYTNYCDAALIFRLVRALLDAGYAADRIGIIAPYRAQVVLLRKLAAQHDAFHAALDFAAVEVNTVDQYQGRDKDIILYSGTKSGLPAGRDLERLRNAEILEDKRRLTVAITRSKHKLILVGDAACLQQYTPFQVLLARIPSHCRLRLEQGKLDFEWQTLLDQLSAVISV